MQVYNRELFAQLQKSIMQDTNAIDNSSKGKIWSTNESAQNSSAYSVSSFASNSISANNSIYNGATRHQLADRHSSPKSVDSRISERFHGRLYFPELKQQRNRSSHENTVIVGRNYPKPVGSSSCTNRTVDDHTRRNVANGELELNNTNQSTTHNYANFHPTDPTTRSRVRTRTHVGRPGATASAPARVDPGNLIKEVDRIRDLQIRHDRQQTAKLRRTALQHHTLVSTANRTQERHERHIQQLGRMLVDDELAANSKRVARSNRHVQAQAHTVLSEAARVVHQCNTLAGAGVRAIRQAVRVAIDQENKRCRVNLEAQARACVLKQQADIITRASVRALDEKLRSEVARVDAIEKERERLRHCFQTEKRRLFLQDAQRQSTEATKIEWKSVGSCNGYAASFKRRQIRSRSMPVAAKVVGPANTHQNKTDVTLSNTRYHGDVRQFEEPSVIAEHVVSRRLSGIGVECCDRSNAAAEPPQEHFSHASANCVESSTFMTEVEDIHYPDHNDQKHQNSKSETTASAETFRNASTDGCVVLDFPTSENWTHQHEAATLYQEQDNSSLTAATVTTNIPNKDNFWYYIDENRVRQGPFDSTMMRAWLVGGYLQKHLLIQTAAEVDYNPNATFLPLNDLFGDHIQAAFA